MRKHLHTSQIVVRLYSKQPILGLTQEWFRELSFCRLESGVHDRLHIDPLCGIFTSPGIDTREKGPTDFSLTRVVHVCQEMWQLFLVSRRVHVSDSSGRISHLLICI